MPTITSSETFSVIDTGETTQESVTIPVISAPVAPDGLGRLAHPTLGTLDYSIAPDEWVNLDTDIVVPPVWAHNKTLSGGTSTRWLGYLRDLEVKERWTRPVAMKAPQFRMMLDMWRTPPSSPSFVVWSPNYVTSNSYNVEIVKITSGGGSNITLDYLVLQGDGFIKGPVEITYRIDSQV